LFTTILHNKSCLLIINLHVRQIY